MQKGPGIRFQAIAQAGSMTGETEHILCLYLNYILLIATSAVHGAVARQKAHGRVVGVAAF